MITVVIPTIPSRVDLLDQALDSVRDQTLQADAVLVQVDVNREGAAAMRNRALDAVHTEFAAFLDDDDVLYPNHLKLCARAARFVGADVIYPGYDADGYDAISRFGLPFDAGLLERRNYIPVTTFCRTEAVRAAGGFQPHPDEHGDPCEDWGLWLAMLHNGATFYHLPHKTWRWSLAGIGTRGRADRW